MVLKKNVRRRSLIVGSILCFLLLNILYFTRRQSYAYPFNWTPPFNPSSGMPPTTTNISLYFHKSPTSNFPCLETSTIPSFAICIYSRLVDEFISRDLEDSGVWEACITKTFQQLLSLDADSIFVDVGANIGYYTLLAGKSGHYVISVEPVLNHVQRLYSGVQLNGVEGRVAVLRNGVAHEKRQATVRRSGHNQGDSQLEMTVHECRGSCPPTVSTILLNDLAYLVSNLSLHLLSHPSLSININHLTRDYISNNRHGLLLYASKHTEAPVILKLDTQGFEHRIFAQADVFFNVNHVTFILMEWVGMTTIHQSLHQTNATMQGRDESFKKAPSSVHDELLVLDMISFLYRRGFRPYSSTAGTHGQPLHPAHWSLWPHDVLWVHVSKLASLRSVFQGGFSAAIYGYSECT